MAVGRRRSATAATSSTTLSSGSSGATRRAGRRSRSGGAGGLADRWIRGRRRTRTPASYPSTIVSTRRSSTSARATVGEADGPTPVVGRQGELRAGATSGQPPAVARTLWPGARMTSPGTPGQVAERRQPLRHRAGQDDRQLRAADATRRRRARPARGARRARRPRAGRPRRRGSHRPTWSSEQARHRERVRRLHAGAARSASPTARPRRPRARRAIRSDPADDRQSTRSARCAPRPAASRSGAIADRSPRPLGERRGSAVADAVRGAGRSPASTSVAAGSAQTARAAARRPRHAPMQGDRGRGGAVVDGQEGARLGGHADDATRPRRVRRAGGARVRRPRRPRRRVPRGARSAARCPSRRP